MNWCLQTIFVDSWPKPSLKYKATQERFPWMISCHHIWVRKLFRTLLRMRSSKRGPVVSCLRPIWANLRDPWWKPLWKWYPSFWSNPMWPGVAGSHFLFTSMGTSLLSKYSVLSQIFREHGQNTGQFLCRKRCISKRMIVPGRSWNLSHSGSTNYLKRFSRFSRFNWSFIILPQQVSWTICTIDRSE